LQGATLLDAEHDTVDEPSDENLPITTDRKAGMGQEEGRHPPLEGEWTHVVGENCHALDLVPNPRASGTFWGRQQKPCWATFFLYWRF